MEEFPQSVQVRGHIIAHLEMLNIVVALKTWGPQWTGMRICVFCDNTNACIAIQSGRSRDAFMQHCAREVFLVSARYDLEVWAFHKPGVQLHRADALSRAHLGKCFRDRIARDQGLRQAHRVRVDASAYELASEL